MIRKGTLLALLGTIIATGTLVAHTLPAGAARKYAADLQSLPYKYAAGVPSWMSTAVAAALGSGWVANNNSRNPRFSYSASGNGTIAYSTMADCFGDALWIGCYQKLSGTAWNIWVRQARVDAGTLVPSWSKLCERVDETGCRMTKRILLHEATHLTLVGSNHDLQQWPLMSWEGVQSTARSPTTDTT